MTDIANQAAFRNALRGVPRFVYANGLQLVALSVVWIVCSLPLLTVGPVTLAVYAAIQDLRSDHNTIDRSRIVTILRQNGVASVVFSGVPILFSCIAVLYGIQAIEQETILGQAIALIAGYVALYFLLVLIPTFNAMAANVPPVTALRRGVRWVSRYPTAALATMLVTIVLLALSIVLTIAFVLVFAGITISVHIAVIEAFDNQPSEEFSSSATTPL